MYWRRCSRSASEEHIEEMFHPFEPFKSLKIGNHEQEALLKPVMQNGEMTIPKRTLSEIAEYSKSRLAELPREYKRFDNPHIYKVGISKALKEERDKIIAEFKYS